MPDVGSLTCIYLSLVGVGVLYTGFILVTGSLTDVFHFDIGGHDLDLGDSGPSFEHGDVSLTSISPVTLAGFVTAFGAMGIIATELAGASERASLLWALFGGLLVGVVSHVAFIYLFILPQGSSEVRRADIVGAQGEVITPIPQGGLGEIAIIAQGSRITFSARSADGAAVARGSRVTVVDVVVSAALVHRQESTIQV
jgi:hypothetical protein